MPSLKVLKANGLRLHARHKRIEERETLNPGCQPSFPRGKGRGLVVSVRVVGERE